MKLFAIKMLGAASGILFAGAGSAAALPGLVHAAGTVSAAGHAAATAGPTGIPGLGANAGASAQASANADLSSASSALDQARALTQTRMATSADQALHLYSSAAGKLTDAARQAEAMARSGMQAGASTLMKVAATINDEVANLTVSTDAGLHATMSAVPDVTTALDSTVRAAQSQGGAARAQVLGVVDQASSNLRNLVTFTPPAGSGAAPGSLSVSASGSGSFSGAGAASTSGSGAGSASASGSGAASGTAGSASGTGTAAGSGAAAGSGGQVGGGAHGAASLSVLG